MTMNVWENGFSIDDGPLRDFNDPVNQRFLQQITRGRIPDEITQQHPGKKVDFHMERKNSPYVKPKAKPFAGEGMRLGSIVPNLAQQPTSSSSTSSAAKPDNQGKHNGNNFSMQWICKAKY